MTSSQSWHFQWADSFEPQALAQLTGGLRWRGFELGFALDGLLGLDARLAAPALATVPGHLQKMVLHHFADECLKTLAVGPFSDWALTAVQWHEDPLPMEGELAFTLRKPGACGSSCGRLTVFNPKARMQLVQALAAHGWSLPATLANAPGQLQIGTVRLTPDELAGLEPGDLVWLDDAELSPSGLRAQFQSHEDRTQHAAWLKRSLMSRDALQAASWAAAAARTPGLTELAVKSPVLWVARYWLTGAQPVQRLPQTALAFTWQAWHKNAIAFEGQLLVIGRRLGLRITQTLQGLPPQPTKVN